MIHILFDFTDNAIFNMYNLIGLIGDTTFMSHNNDGLPLSMQFFQNVHHFYRSLTIQSTGRLIGENNLRMCYQCTSNGYSLFLPTTHFIRHGSQHGQQFLVRQRAAKTARLRPHPV